MKTRRTKLIALSAALSLGTILGACSCEDSKTKGQRPVKTVDLPLDTSGVAHYLLDFGEVPVGSRSDRKVTIRNVGATELLIQGEGAAEPFTSDMPPDGLHIGVGESARAGFSFAPTEATDGPIDQIVRLMSNEKAEDAERLVRLVGHGVPPGLDCAPNPLVFGSVVRGSLQRKTVVCTNPLNVELELETANFHGNYASAYSLEIQGAAIDGKVKIPSKVSIQLEVTFKATSVGRNDSRLLLRDPNNKLLSNIGIEAETVSRAVVVQPADCLDFGYVELGATVSKSFLLTNVGSQDLEVLDLRLSEIQARQFSVETETPFELEADHEEAKEVVVSFHPSESGRQSSQLSIVTDALGDDGMVTTCVTGFGGGPKLRCVPEQRDFGLVAVGTVVTRELVCTNVGDAPEEGSIDPLMIEELFSDDPAFSAVVLDDEREPASPRDEGYAAGESFTVQVSFRPQEEGFVAAKIRVRTNVSVAETYAIDVSGEGRALPSCDFSISPPQLNFGTVERGAELRRSFTVENHLETDCLISDLRLSEASDPYFSVEPIENTILAGGEGLDVEVRFLPADYRERAEGEVVFQISNQENPLQRVPLIGRSAFPCVLVEPNPIDFGKTGLGCFTSDRTIKIANVCGTSIVITDIDREETRYAADFHVVEFPNFDLTLEPNASAELVMRFKPSALGVREGLLGITMASSVEEPTQYFVTLVGEGAVDLIQSETFVQAERTKVDVLWVVDNSSSMHPWQEAIADRLEAFMTSAMAQDIDYHIAVTTTGLHPGGGCIISLVAGAENGRFFPVDADNHIPPRPRILKRSTPGLTEAWRRNVDVGTCHGIEEPYEAALRALTPPLSTSVKDPRPGKTGHPDWNDGNAGFLRDDASLAVVVMTDESDQSYHYGKAPLHYVEALRNIKQPKFRESFKLHAITVPATTDPSPSCGMFRDRGDRLLQGVQETNGVWFNICTPLSDTEAWDAGMRRISREVFEYSTSFRLKGRPASAEIDQEVQPEDLEVWLDGQRIEHRDQGAVIWSYDPVANAVNFMPASTPRPGTVIEIKYRVACL